MIIPITTQAIMKIISTTPNGTRMPKNSPSKDCLLPIGRAEKTSRVSAFLRFLSMSQIIKMTINA